MGDKKAIYKDELDFTAAPRKVVVQTAKINPDGQKFLKEISDMAEAGKLHMGKFLSLS